MGTLSGSQLCVALPAHHMQRLLLHIVHIHCQHGGAQVSRSRELPCECQVTVPVLDLGVESMHAMMQIAATTSPG